MQDQEIKKQGAIIQGACIVWGRCMSHCTGSVFVRVEYIFGYGVSQERQRCLIELKFTHV